MTSRGEQGQGAAALETVVHREVLDAVPDAIYLVDDTGHLFDANRAACEQLGAPLAELVGTSLEAITRNPVLDAASLQERAASAGHVTVETEHLRRDGTKVPVELMVARVQHGGRWFLLHVARDVTRRRAVDVALASSEHRYRSLVENLPGQVAIMFDRDLRFELVDGPEVQTTGLTKSFMEGRLLREALPPEFADVVEPNMRRVLAGERFSAELPFEDRTYHYEYVPLRGPDGTVEHGLILGQNVTDRVRAAQALADREQQYRTLAEHLPDVVARFDREGRFLFVNPVAEAVGVSPTHAIGKTLGELGMPEAAAWKQALDEVFATGQPVAREDTVPTAGGPRRWAARLVPERTGEAVETVLVLSRDVTEERRAEEERRALEAGLRQAGKLDALGRLAGGVAHDFNNLLTVIEGYAQLLVNKPSLDEAVRADLEEVLEAARRGSSLTTQLLAFSRKHVTAPTYVDPDVLVRQLLRMLQRLLGEDISVEFDAGSAHAVHVDASQLEQVLMNLAANARDAMPNGGRLEVATSSVEVDAARAQAAGATGGRYVRLRVRDTGQGMSAETLEHLFEPFFTTKAAGTGLGLSIAHGIVHKHKGFLEVASTLGKGSTFDVYLPAVDRARLGAANASTEVSRPRGAHILLVEDERPVLNVTARILRDHGYVVHPANTADEALRLAEDPDTRIDLVLTDVIMPTMSGPQLVARLRELRGELKVLFMSGYTDDALSQAGISTGTSFLQKPFAVPSLLAKVAEVLGESVAG